MEQLHESSAAVAETPLQSVSIIIKDFRDYITCVIDRLRRNKNRIGKTGTPAEREAAQNAKVRPAQSPRPRIGSRK